MKRKIPPIGFLVALVAAVFLLWMALPAPVAQANVVDGVGEWTVNDNPPAPDHGTADDGDPGYDADPDTFQIDSWAGAVLDEVPEPGRPSRGLPGSGQFGWFLSWLLIVFGSRYFYWGSGS